ncbi:MAG: hypothetical protein ACJ74U_05170 [Jatrophihabitantaceae bacterium]
MPVLLWFGMLASAPAASAAVFDTALTRAPYLTDLVGNHVNVNWATNQSATTGTLQWGPISQGVCSLGNSLTATRSTITVGTVSEYQWKASLNLPSSGSYCYRPQLAAVDLLAGNSSPQFQTQVPAGDNTPYSFDVFGDWGQVDATGASTDQANLFQQVATSGARFAVTVGDNGYPSGSQLNYGDLQQSGQDISAIFGPSFWTVAGSTVPLFTAAGNHGLSGPAHTDISTWTQDSAVASSGGRYQNDVYCCVNGSSSSNYGSEWYAFDAGPARFYLLDSAWGDSNVGTGSVYANDAAAHFAPGTPEYSWLLNDLQTHPSSLKFAFSHYPFYADNPNQSSDTSLQGLTGLEGLLGQYGVDIVFNGHAHLYQRNQPSAVGMPVSYVTGGGGAAPQPVGPCTANDAYGIGWSPTKLTGSACGAATPPSAATQVFHFLKVTVAGNTVTVAPTDETGQSFDVQTYTFSNVPDTVVDSAPPPLTNSSTATLSFHSTRAGASLACSLDGAPATSCTSPVSYGSLASGNHSFAVTATTSYGTDPTPATANWTVDVSPPTTPTNLTGTAQSATVVSLSWAAATDNNGVASYDIQRNGSTIGSTGSPATSYLDTTAAPSTSYQYTVIARDAAGNASAPSGPTSVSTPASTGLPTLVQSAGSSTTTVTLPGTSAPGDLLVLTAGVYTGASKQITAVSDGRNTWTKAGAYTVAGQNSDGELWYAANAAPVRTVTVTTTAPVALGVQEFTNMASTTVLDGAVGTAALSKPASSGSITPTVGNDLAIGFVAGHANAQAITVTSPGYAVGPQQNTTNPSTVTLISGSQVLSGTTTQSFAGSFTNTMYWSAGLALFKAAPAPANDFSISASPASVSVVAGQGGTSTISTAVTSGNPQTVALSASGAPAGASVAFSPASVTAGQSSTATITTSTTTPAGNYPITITGTGSATHGVSLTLIVTAPPPPPGPQLVQAIGATETSSSTALTATLPAPSTAGNLLVLSASVYTGTTNHITSITDSAGNIWQKVNAWSVASHNSDGELWYAANAAGASTVTAHTASAASIAFEVQEFSGVATSSPLDTSAGTANTGTSASSGSITPAGAGELLIGFAAGHASSQQLTVTSTGYTLQPQQTSTGSIATVVTGCQLTTGTGAISFDASFGTAMYWAGGIAAFRAG